MVGKVDDTCQICNYVNFVISALHQALFQACNRLEEFLKDAMLAPFPRNMIHWLNISDIRLQ
jgi:hypothetical protein